MRLRQRLIVLALMLCSGPGLAHKLAPALLDITPGDNNSYSVLWRVGLQTAPLNLQWPDDCSADAAAIRRVATGLDQRFTLQCQNPLAGRSLAIQGLEAARTAVLIRENNDQAQVQTLITASQPDYRFSYRRGQHSVMLEYLILGIEHILIGLDHLLLIVGLFLITRGWRSLAANVTAFTLGHSVTLAAASLNILKLPSAWVELTIAATILMLALSLSRKTFKPHKLQWLLFSIFGLIHGMGFAGVLGDIGLPRNDLVAALLAFNIGIEVGQIAFLAALGLLFALTRRIHPRVARVVQGVAVYSMGSLACFWCIERGLTLLK